VSAVGQAHCGGCSGDFLHNNGVCQVSHIGAAVGFIYSHAQHT